MTRRFLILGFCTSFAISFSPGCDRRADEKNDSARDDLKSQSDTAMKADREQAAAKKVLPRDRLNWSGKPKPGEWGYIHIPKGDDEALKRALEASRRRRELAMKGIEYEKLEPLPPPEIQNPAPKVKVVDMGPKKLPVEEDIQKVFTDENDRLKYLVTRNDIVFLDANGRVIKRVKMMVRSLSSGACTEARILSGIL